jgi:hypothetical protein
MNQIAKDRAIKFAILLAIFMGGFGTARLHKHVKHTGPARVVMSQYGHVWFTRPDNEVFEMWFDNPPPINSGLSLADIAYTDDNRDERHFLSMTLATK